MCLPHSKVHSKDDTQIEEIIQKGCQILGSQAKPNYANVVRQCSENMLFQFLIFSFATDFLVKLSPGRLPMRPNNFSALRKRRYWLTGLNISAQLAIHSVNTPFSRKLRISVAKNPLGTGSPCFSSDIPASNWANHPGSTLNVPKHSITPWSVITLICLRKSLRRMRYHGRMSIIWMRKVVKGVEVGKLHNENILCLEQRD